MKTLLIASALAFLITPASAGISDVDHPDIPNCTIVGPNAADCETLTMQAVYPPNGLWRSTVCREVSGETVCKTVIY
jgi:hypothetical protein